MSDKKSKLVALLGPTASGKTGWGILLAQKFNGEIISADSRQIYKHMDIGTAKPSEAFKGAKAESFKTIKSQDGMVFNIPMYLIDDIHHYLFNVVNPDEDFTVAHFKEISENLINETLSRNHVPLIVGGTGFYISSVVDNLSFPHAEPDQEFRSNLEQQLKDDVTSVEALYKELLTQDPEAASFVEPHNSRRIIRSLEVIQVTGEPLSKLRTKGEQKYDVLQIGIRLEKEVLEERINSRVDQMIDQGLIDEVKVLLETYDASLPALSGIGYREITEYINGSISQEEAIELIKLRTKQYAKRQMKWFKRDSSIQWVDSLEKAEQLVSKFV